MLNEGAVHVSPIIILVNNSFGRFHDTLIFNCGQRIRIRKWHQSR